jgi:hypothetical protein
MHAGQTYYLYVEEYEQGVCSQFTLSVYEVSGCCATLDPPIEALEETEPNCEVPQAIDCSTAIYATYGRYTQLVGPIHCDYLSKGEGPEDE